MKTKIIAITNQKGGVCKTTTATAMAAALNRKGYKTLLVDTDQQCNATDTFRAETEDVATLYDVMIANEPVITSIQHMEAGDILPGDNLLSEIEQRMTQQGREYRLKEALEPLDGMYDYIIIDTPPGLGIMLTNALTAADSCIIPITADRYGLQGLSQLDETIGRVRKYSNRDLEIDGLLFCKFKPNQLLSKSIMSSIDKVAEALETKVFKTYIRESVATKMAQAEQMTIFEKDPRNNTARDYLAFIEEYLGGEVENG